MNVKNLVLLVVASVALGTFGAEPIPVELVGTAKMGNSMATPPSMWC